MHFSISEGEHFYKSADISSLRTLFMSSAHFLIRLVAMRCMNSLQSFFILRRQILRQVDACSDD